MVSPSQLTIMIQTRCLATCETNWKKGIKPYHNSYVPPSSTGSSEATDLGLHRCRAQCESIDKCEHAG